MKKLLLFSCLLILGFNSYAQIKRNVVITDEISPVQLPSECIKIDHSLKFNSNGQGSTSSNKTSGDAEDRPQNAYFQDLIDGILPKCEFISFQKTNLGILNGTFGPFDIKFNDGSEHSLYIQEHAIQFKVSPHSTKRFVWLSNVYIGFISADVVGDPDKFKIRVYPTEKKGDQTTILAPVQELTFDLKDRLLIGEPNFDNKDGNVLVQVVQPTDKSEANALKSNVDLYLLSVESKTSNSDDSYSFWVANPTKVCDANDDYNWLIRLQDANIDTLSIWDNTNRLFGLPPKDSPNLDPDIPFFVPILTYETPNGMEDDLSESLGQNRDLTLYGAGPNPAVESTNIKYEFSSNSTASIKVMDMNGRTVHYSGEFDIAKGINNYHLDTSKLPCGHYTYIVQSRKGSMGGKFIVNK